KERKEEDEGGHICERTGCSALTSCDIINMSSNINISLENPYGQVTIPRAKLRLSEDATVITNPVALNSENPYAQKGSDPPPYTVKEDGGEEEGGRCQACCYRCRRRK
ncbi:hypothetical protein CHARACLAT_025261, partial [Characodon lateralis]|nr:hypothetical protein [Characodon lateralis]